MFWHLFSYKLRCILRDKQTLFWSAAFPIVLAALFGLAFSNLDSNELFTQIPVAVVDNDAYRQSNAFKSALFSAASGKDALFNPILCTKDEAKALVEEGSVAGSISMGADGEVYILVKETGISQTILKAFLDSFVQLSHAFKTVAETEAQAAHKFASLLENEAVYIKEAKLYAEYPNKSVIYFFALISMACLYGSFHGVNAVSSVQANQSHVAARCNMAPVHKLLLFGAQLSAALLVQFISCLLLIVFMKFVIGVQFGSRLFLIIFTCAIGASMGVILGALVGALLKQRLNLKIGIIISLSMVLTSLAGLQYPNLKYIIHKSLPLLSYVNPAALVTDAFYALYYYEGLERYFMNIGLLLGFCAVFLFVVYGVMRRQKYASL